MNTPTKAPATTPLVDPPCGGTWLRNPITGELTRAAAAPTANTAPAAPPAQEK